MTDCAKFAELISAMLDGELTAEEESLVKEHIENCTECAQMYEMFALVSGELESDLAGPPADLKDKVMSGIKPAKKKKGIIVSLRPYMTAAACLVLVIGIFAAGRGGFGMRADNAASTAPRAAAPETAMADTAGDCAAPMAPMAPEVPAEPEAPAADAGANGTQVYGDNSYSCEYAEEPMEDSAASPVIYVGTVVDRAMSKVNENDLTGRAYIGIEFDDGTGEIFWLARGYELPEELELGDRVEIESEIEKNTGLLAATQVSIIE